MRSKDRNVLVAFLVLGVIFVGVGIIPLATVGLPLPSTISGSDVYDEATCSNGFGAGSCPVIFFEWSGSLIAPNVAANILENVLHETLTTSCGIEGLYLSNIPVVNGQGGKPDAEYQPYLPPSGYEGYVVYNSVTYLESGSYSTGDGCGSISSTGTVTTTATTTHSTIGFGLPGIGTPSLDLSIGTLAVAFFVLCALYLVVKRGKRLGI